MSIAPDGRIFIMSPAAEMGQGSMTSLPRIIAEELDADWDKVQIVPAPTIDAIYANPGFGMLYTAGSNAVTSYFTPSAQIRPAGTAGSARKCRAPMGRAGFRTEHRAVHRHSRRFRPADLTYGEIAAFAVVPEKAPEISERDLKPTKNFRYIGKDSLRVDLPGKVAGRAEYAIDVQVPGMIYGAVLRSPVEGAAPAQITDESARNIPGILEIVPLPYGVGILADNPWAAFSARQALIGNVTWTRDGRAWGFDSERGTAEFAAAARDLSSPATLWDKRGDAVGEFSRAATVIEADYVNDYAYHAQMEPLNAVASVSRAGDAAEIWCGTQSQTMAQEAVAKVLGIERAKVTLHDKLLGGAFGRRGHRDEEFIIDAVLLAKHSGRPVKMMWTREDDVHNGRLRPLSAHHLRAGTRFLREAHRVASAHRR